MTADRVSQPSNPEHCDAVGNEQVPDPRRARSGDADRFARNMSEGKVWVEFMSQWLRVPMITPDKLAAARRPR